ncbi:MAG: ATP-dependent protease [Gammaproteobacteria bacterium HGW-Gammaproteobacteria-1]|jgi:lon-related putative ATP-dependent protease|nr:MAG: ATP-dependent protease [Gammaproteobacteria bacterium HGW-Gammaproteobacteria-1]
MSKPEPLAPEVLYKRCDPGLFGFETTAELPDLTEVIGQARAIGAVHFGVNIRREGYNLYVMGPPGIGKHTLVRQFLQQKADACVTPDDWCYVNNFETPHKPHALRLPPGRGMELKHDMEKLVEELGVVLPATFEGDEYRSRIQALEEELKEHQEKDFGALAEEAGKQNVKLFRTPSGFAFAPMKDDEVLGPDEFEKLPKDEQERIEHIVAALQEKLQALIRQIPLWRKETREKVKDLNRDTSMAAVNHLIEEIKQRYTDLPRVVEYLAAVEQDVINNVRNFVHSDESAEGMPDGKGESLHRYQVNVLVDNKETEGAPIVYLDNPTYLNLVGRAEHVAQFGTLITDFTLIKSGALHQASGGYLLVDAYKLLTHSFAWEGLKRALYSSEIRIESLEKMLSLVSTVSLEPEAIPLDVKVVIIGDRMTYYLLHEYDPDFAELFKVAADFEGRLPRTDDNKQIYAQLIATLSRKEKLRPFDRGAVARVIEHGSRLVEDTEHLTTHMRSIADVLREADYWAGEAGHEVVGAVDIEQAIDHQIHRSSRVREHLQDEIRRGTIMIATDGAQIGQINGLSVLSMGDFAFGQPSRITANVHIGEGGVVDIEREVELGGAIHSKGVMILSSFLAARYATHYPLALSASLVFEQNYGMVDGDSASLAELCALMSALAELPVAQSFAMTGSVNQHGQVQPIGGVNEKIEGFFDVCRLRGLTGKQGVLIPASNVKHLMLRQDVVQAVAEQQFRIFAVETVDQALGLLMDAEAGVADEDGNWPADSINGRVQARLSEMAHIRASFGDHGKDKHDDSPPPDTSDADAPPRHVD